MRVHLELRAHAAWGPLEADGGRMLGGRERLGLRLARLLAEAGHEVSLRGPVLAGPPGAWAGVVLLNPPDPVGAVDVFVGIDAEPTPDVVAARRIAWSHAAQWPMRDEWDLVVAVSRGHAALLAPRHARVVSIPAGCDLPPIHDEPRDRFLYASSPDRGLSQLLDLWPALWERFGLPLSVTYDLRRRVQEALGRTDPVSERVRLAASRVDTAGVIVHGPLTDEGMDALRARSAVLLYPYYPILPYSELYSLAVLEACAAGCVPVVPEGSPLAAEHPAVMTAQDLEPATWLDAVARALAPGRAADVRAYAATRPWSAFAAAWEDALRRPPRRTPTMPSDTQRWLVAAGGIGLGEAALARPVIEAAREAGHDVLPLALAPHLVPTMGPGAVSALGPDATAHHLARGWDRIVLSDAAMCAPVLPLLRGVAPLTRVASLEYNSLERMELIRDHERIDVCYVCVPPRVWEVGVAGPHPMWPVRDAAYRRTKAVGWLPGVRAPAVVPDLVLVYLGLLAGEWSTLAMACLLPALAEAHAAGFAIAVVGAWEGMPPWVETKGILPFEACDPLFDRGALVVCHAGAGTVSSALARGAPVLVLTPGRVLGAEAACPGDRFGQVLGLAGCVEHLPLPFAPEDTPDGLAGIETTRRLRALVPLLLRERRTPEGGGAAQVVRDLSAPAPAGSRWRPPEFVP